MLLILKVACVDCRLLIEDQGKSETELYQHVSSIGLALGSATRSSQGARTLLIAHNSQEYLMNDSNVR